MGGIVNELSTLLLFKSVIKVLPGLQKSQGSISLITALPGLPHPELGHTSITLGREGLPANSVHQSPGSRLYRFFSCLISICSSPVEFCSQIASQKTRIRS
jgi:hypothetical protein